MRFEFFIALRYLTSMRKRSFISLVSIMSVLGVALGVGALVVVMGVYNGFTTDLRDKILGANSHVIIQSTLPAGFDLNSDGEGGYKQIVDDMLNLDGVRAVAPFLYTEVLISTPRGATGLVIRGIEPKDASEVLPMLQHLDAGNLDGMIRPIGAQGIIIGKELATRFGILVGSRVNLLSPAGDRTLAGFKPKIVSFKVVGIFKAGMNDYDNRLAFISLEAARDLVGITNGRVSGVELYLDDPYTAKEFNTLIDDKYTGFYYSNNWMKMNIGLFAALELERIGMFIVLALIVLVGSFSIITSLVMLVMEKTKDIAIMISMGATSKNIRRIFMLQGTIIGFVGTMAGLLAGLTVAYLLTKYQFIELPPGIYTTDHLPVLISLQDNVLVAVSSMFMCFLATIYPARQAAKLLPTEALRYE